MGLCSNGSNNNKQAGRRLLSALHRLFHIAFRLYFSGRRATRQLRPLRGNPVESQTAAWRSRDAA